MKITTSDRAGPDEHARAARLARDHGFTPTDDPGQEPALVVTRTGLALRRGDVLSRWHPGMLHALRSAGDRHPWVRLGGLHPGQQVLDSTLGLGTDAQFLAEITGRTVIGIEAVPAIALVTREGLASAGADVDVRIGLATDLLAEMPDSHVDAVIADPMFPRRGGDKSRSLDALREIARPEPLDAEWLEQALRVARGPVLVKDLRGNDLLERLGADRIWQRRDRSARYGVWRSPSVLE